MLPVTAAPAPGHPQEGGAEHQAPAWVVLVGWENEVTPSCTWKCLKSQVDWVAETVVLLVYHHRCLVVEGNSTAQLLGTFFSLVRSLVQCGFSTNIPKSVP